MSVVPKVGWEGGGLLFIYLVGGSLFYCSLLLFVYRRFPCKTKEDLANKVWKPLPREK